MPAKPKKPIPLALANLDQLHTTVDEVAMIEVEIRSLEAARDKAIQTVRSEHDGKIEGLKKRIKNLVSIAETYSVARRETVFGKLKSAASRLTRFGFRDGNPSLCLLNKKWTWDLVLSELKKTGKDEFVRTVEEIDKDKLKGSKLTDVELAAIGCRLDSKERFYVEPKTDDATRITAEPQSAE